MVDRQRWVETVRANWNERATQWDALSEENAVTPDRLADLERTAKALGLQPGSTLLDAGSGSGQFANGFARMGYRVTAIDLSPDMIAIAKLHERAYGHPIDWRIGDIASVEIDDASFDAIHARVILQFVPSVADTLEAFRQALKPGGRLYASVPGSLSPIYNRSFRRFLDRVPPSANYITPWELESVLIELGWSILDGWGSYGQSLSGDPNVLTTDAAALLPRKLQQAAATMWAVIAE